jgi:hypothetical protein
MGLISDIQLNRSVGSYYHNQLYESCEFIIESLSKEVKNDAQRTWLCDNP